MSKTVARKASEATRLAYAGLVRDSVDWVVAVVDPHGRVLVTRTFTQSVASSSPQRLTRSLLTLARELSVKIVGCGIIGNVRAHSEAIGTALWLEADIVPHFLKGFPKKDAAIDRAKALAKTIATTYWDRRIARIIFGEHREVIPAALTGIEAYQKHLSGRAMLTLATWAERFRAQKLKLVFLSSTPAGGGVALMRHALIRLARLLGLSVHWHVLLPDPKVFEITKNKFHNILQGVAGRKAPLARQDKLRYEAWIAKNAELLEPAYRDADVVVIDDPQPSGLISYIRQVNPQAKIIYRSHIQIRADLLHQAKLPQAATWNYLRSAIHRADLFVSHPIKAFLPTEIPLKKVVSMPATTDPLDGLNKPLTEREIRAYQKIFNALLVEQGQKPLRLDRPYIIQIARFDPSKGIPDVVEAYRRFRKRFADLGRPAREIPQLVIMGNGAIDDPEGKLVLDETFFLLEMDRYRDIASGVRVLQVPHIDQLLNAMLRGSAIALQLSHREGFEVKVTEAISKGIPVIAYRTGGIPLQIRSGVNGVLARTGDTKQVAELLFRYFTDTRYAEKLQSGAKRTPQGEFWTVASLTRWLYLACRLASDELPSGQFRRVEQLMN